MYNYKLNKLNKTYDIYYSEEKTTIVNLIKIFKDTYKCNKNIFVYLKNNENIQNYNTIVTYTDNIFIIQQSYNYMSTIDLQLYINKFNNFNIDKEKYNIMTNLILNGANINKIVLSSYDLYKIYCDSNDFYRFYQI